MMLIILILRFLDNKYHLIKFSKYLNFTYDFNYYSL